MSCEVCRGSGCEHKCPCCRKEIEPIKQVWTYYNENDEKVTEKDNWFVREDQFCNLEYLKLKTMQAKIKEVQDYFKSKILNGEFEVSKITEYKIHLVVDSKFEFVIWAGNTDIPEVRKNTKTELSFMNLELSNNEAIQLDKILKQTIFEFRKNVLIKQKEEELQQLKNTL